MKAWVPPRPGRLASPQRVLPPQTKPRYTRDEQKIRRRQDLLDAAWALFCDKGYEAVTIDEVADHAGCSRQPVYSLFGDKQNLFFELHRVAISETVAMLDRFLVAGALLRDNLSRFADFVTAELNDKKPNYGHRLFFVVQTIALSRPEIAERMRGEARYVLEALARGIRLSRLEADEQLRGTPEDIAAHLAGFINGMTTVQFQTQQRYANETDLAAIFMAIVFRNAPPTAAA